MADLSTPEGKLVERYTPIAWRFRVWLMPPSGTAAKWSDWGYSDGPTNPSPAIGGRHQVEPVFALRELGELRNRASAAERERDELKAERDEVIEEVIATAEAYNEEYGDPADTLHHGRGLIDAIRALSPERKDKSNHG